MFPILAAGALAASAYPPCTPNLGVACEVRVPFSPAAIEELLTHQQEAWWVAGDTFNVVARRAHGAHLCCALQLPLRPLGNGLYAVSVWVPDIETAIMDVVVLPDSQPGRAPAEWRGRLAPPAPKGAAGPHRPWETHEIQSVHLGQTRPIYVSVPEGIETLENVPVIYLADGRTDSFAGIAHALSAEGKASPVIIVGIESAPTGTDRSCFPQCDPRNQEYLPSMPDAAPHELRFDEHARFVLDEVIPFVESQYPVAREASGRATAGFSSGATWALAMAARHPEAFGNAIALSVGWTGAPEEAKRLEAGKLFIGAGRLEPRFFRRSTEAAEAARRAGAEVRLVTLNAGHNFGLWDMLLADALPWVFPR